MIYFEIYTVVINLFKVLKVEFNCCKNVKIMSGMCLVVNVRSIYTSGDIVNANKMFYPLKCIARKK